MAFAVAVSASAVLQAYTLKIQSSLIPVVSLEL